MTNEQMANIASWLNGTCRSETQACEHFELDESDAEEILSRINDYGIERCRLCDWWMETHELNDDQLCIDCR